MKPFDTMSTLGITLTQKWTLTAVENVANKMDDLENRVKNTGFHTTHDNINRMFHVSHQQTGHNSHFDSGTAATVLILPNENDYQLPKTNEEFLRQAVEGAKIPITSHEIQELHASAAPRIFNATSLSGDRQYYYVVCLRILRIFAQHVHTVLKILISTPGFKFNTYEHRNSEIFDQPPASEALPTGPGHALDQFVMNTCQINESSYDGNEQLVEEWARQLKLDTDEEKESTGRKRIVIWSGDQPTTSRLRGLKTFRSKDNDPYEHFGWIEPIF